MDLKNKTALVTGASRGIGKAILQSLGEAGAQVIGTATSDVGVNAIEAATQAIGGKGLLYNAGQDGSLTALMNTINKEFGGVDILVANAGITDDGLAMRLKQEQWQSVIDINLTAVFALIQANLRAMAKKRHGRIIAISSIVASIGNVGQSNYCAAKAGLDACCRSIAKEMATRGITVNTVAPGFIETDMTNKLPDAVKDYFLNNIPMNRAGTPDDIASLVKFLSSDAASYITGQTLHVNGGMYMN